MEILLVFMLFSGVLSMVYLCNSVLSLLISLEFLVLTLFFFLSQSYMKDSFMEILMFLVFIVIESLLGLVLLLLMVFFQGTDFLNNFDVF